MAMGFKSKLIFHWKRNYSKNSNDKKYRCHGDDSALALYWNYQEIDICYVLRTSLWTICTNIIHPVILNLDYKIHQQKPLRQLPEK